MSNKKPFTPVLAVLNMKGGVGKTTISANVLRVLFERRRLGTLLLDLDPQFNLTQTLFTRAQYDKKKAAGQTIAAVMEPAPNVGLFTVKTSALPPPSAKSLVRTFYHFPEPNHKTLDLLPGDFSLVKYSLMDDHRKLNAVKARFLSFIEAEKANYGLLGIDCNPSSSFLTLCALHACSHVLVPVRPDRYSMLGLEMLNQFIQHVPTIDPKPELIIVLNGRPRGGGSTDVKAVETELRGHGIFGARTLANAIPNTTLLQARTSYTGFATDRRVAWSTALRQSINAVADELAGKLGIK